MAQPKQSLRQIVVAFVFRAHSLLLNAINGTGNVILRRAGLCIASVPTRDLPDRSALVKNNEKSDGSRLTANANLLAVATSYAEL